MIPFAISAPGGLETARVRVAHAAQAACAFGLDVDGVVRVDDSFTDGTLELAEEMDGSLVVLGWSGPRFASDYVFGNEVDWVGQKAELPTVAARILRPWRRIFVATGNLEVDWHAEDADLALAAARGLRGPKALPVVAITPDPKFIEGKLGAADGVEVVHELDEREAIITKFGADDLVIVPAHVIHDLPPINAWRVARHLQNVNIAVVAGPNRMTLSKGLVNRPVESLVHSHA